MAGRIARTLATHPWFVAEKGDTIVGYAYGSEHRSRRAYRWSCDVSVYVAAAARGHGVGRALYRPLLTTLADQGFTAAFAGITLPNPASIGLHEHLGFTPVGVFRDVGFKHGAWHDVGWWRRPLALPDPAPREPVPFMNHRRGRAFFGKD